jgi:hypothetical protein
MAFESAFLFISFSFVCPALGLQGSSSRSQTSHFICTQVHAMSRSGINPCDNQPNTSRCGELLEWSILALISQGGSGADLPSFAGAGNLRNTRLDILWIQAKSRF